MVARLLFIIFLIGSFAGDLFFKYSVAPQINGFQVGPLEIVDSKQPASLVNFLLINLLGLGNLFTVKNVMIFLSLAFTLIILSDFKDLKKIPFKKGWHCGIIDGLFFGTFLNQSCGFLLFDVDISNFKLALGNISLVFGTTTVMLIVLAIYLPSKLSFKQHNKKGDKS